MRKGVFSYVRRSFVHCRVVACLLLACIFVLPIYAETNDSISSECRDVADEYSFRPSQIVLPSVIIAAGSIGLIKGWPRQMSEDISNSISGRGRHKPVKIDDYIQYLPVVAYVGMGAIGMECRHGIVERILAGVTAYAIMAVATNVSKLVIHRKRPFSNKDNSFPSGHTATVFTGAELLRIEYGTAAAIGGYAVAIGVAFMRIYNHRHWINDVVAGAGIGILSARAGYWMLPLYRKWFKLDKKRGETIALLPNITPGGSFGLSMAMTI